MDGKADRMHTFKAELHVHTLLSPCAGVEMIPPLIVDETLRCGIQIIAITDHNASANTEAVMRAARGTSLFVLPGMELQTREDVHLLCLFDTLDQLRTWQARVDTLLPDVPNQVDYFGEQFVVDETGEFIRHEERLLLNAAGIELDQAAQEVIALGGLAIPAHVDRKSNGLLEILGLVPPQFDVLEISRHTNPEAARKKFPQLQPKILIQNGDVHQLDGFLGKTYLTIAEPTIQELNMAFHNQNGRQMQIR
jgi:PHP family Zn ribbon phosphoesterase